MSQIIIHSTESPPCDEGLDALIQTVYEDKVVGKIPEDVCIGLLEKYQAEKKNLQAEYDELQSRLDTERQDEKDVEEFIRRLRKYAGATELTRQMCFDLIEYVTVDENNKNDRSRPREITFMISSSTRSLQTSQMP